MMMMIIMMMSSDAGQMKLGGFELAFGVSGKGLKVGFDGGMDH